MRSDRSGASLTHPEHAHVRLPPDSCWIAWSQYDEHVAPGGGLTMWTLYAVAALLVVGLVCSAVLTFVSDATLRAAGGGAGRRE
ncbi:MAG: hypothetical protein IPH13_20845 [Planctomycetes bacterium]|nr:hypothetical protein [Planctomycetota bacterium]